MRATPKARDRRTVRRRHPAGRARVAVALLSVGGLLGAAGGMAFVTSGPTTSSATASPAAAASTSTKVVTTTHGS